MDELNEVQKVQKNRISDISKEQGPCNGKNVYPVRQVARQLERCFIFQIIFATEKCMYHTHTHCEWWYFVQAQKKRRTLDLERSIVSLVRFNSANFSKDFNSISEWSMQVIIAWIVTFYEMRFFPPQHHQTKLLYLSHDEQNSTYDNSIPYFWQRSKNNNNK